MQISKTLWEKVVGQWWEVFDKTSYATYQGIPNLFPSNDITNKTDEYIDVNYKDILVTFNVGTMGNAVLSKSFEIYNENGVFIGCADITKVPKLIDDKYRDEFCVEDRIVDWHNEFGVFALNRHSRLFENASELKNTIIVLYDFDYALYDENEVVADLSETRDEMVFGQETYTIYNHRHQLIGFAYNREKKKR